MIRRAFKAAFPKTLPVMAGYLFLSLGFGILLSKSGYGAGWAFFMSAGVYAGAMQFVTIDLLLSGASLIHSALITLLVNARHLFYGITMAAAYRDTGRLKPYLAFSLTDETFAVLSILEVPEHISPKWFYFAVSFLHQLYWVIGSVLGGLAGMLIPWDLKGLDFSMTALFVVLLTEQWRRKDARVPVLIGLSCALIGRFLFGSSQFIFPAMLMIVAMLFLFRGKLSSNEAEEVR